MTNFVIWDIESSGLSTKYDQMITFAAVLTDDNFNILEEFSLKGTPNKGVLPAFGALSTNGIKMTELQKGNLSQYQMVLQIWKKFSEWSNIKPITFISQNGFRFDEEMLRHSFYMNLLPVFMTNTGGNCRCDSLHIFKSTAIFRPGLLKIPSSNGKMTLALEAMAKENNLPHLAHNALGDCTVLVKLLKIIADADPDFFKQNLLTASKNAVFDYVSNNSVFCHPYTYYKKYILSLVAFRPKSPRSEILCFDMAKDPSYYFDFTTQELSKIIRKKDSPFVILKSNKMPSLFPLSYRNYISDNRIINEELFIRSEHIRSNLIFQDRCLEALDLSARSYPENSNAEIEEQIYSGGFPSSRDQYLMQQFHELEWHQRLDICNQFESSKHRSIGLNIIYQEQPDLLPKEIRVEIKKKIDDRLNIIENRPRNIHQSIHEFEKFKEEHAGVQQYLVDDYENFLHQMISGNQL